MHVIEAGRERKVSRCNTLMPQPVSGVPSRNIRPRTPFAIRDDKRRSQVSRRDFTIAHDQLEIAHCALLHRAPQAAGISAGSFCPSPSRVATHLGTRRSHAGQHSATLCPERHAVTQQADLRHLACRARADVADRPVGARVVDENDLERTHAGEHVGDLAGQRRDVVGLVANRDYDRQDSRCVDDGRWLMHGSAHRHRMRSGGA